MEESPLMSTLAGGNSGIDKASFLLVRSGNEVSEAFAGFSSVDAISSTSSSDPSSVLHRFLQDDSSRGRTILTVLYLAVLSLCFLVPVFYYFRMHCEERHARRLRELELAGITQAMEQSQNLHREESRAARRKF